MFTKRTEEDDVVVSEAVKRDESGADFLEDDRLELGELESAAVQRHSEVVSETKWLMIEWIILLSINFVMHYMRMSIVMLYCIEKFGASEVAVGTLVTVHMLIIGVANCYLCYVIDQHSFEPLMIVRFSLLTLATLGEYFANSFVLFASIYCAASLAVVWFGVQSAYSVQMLPAKDAKLLSNIGILMNQTGIVLGLASGGLVGGLISLRTVFLVSSVVAFLSLLWILCFLWGKESRIKRIQADEISQLYRDFPHLFQDANERFPMVFLDQDHQHHHHQPDSLVSPSSPNVAAKASEANNQAQPALETQRSREGGMTEYFDDFLCSLESLPFWVLTIRNGVMVASQSEMMAWYNVYAEQVYDAPVEQSSLQFVVAVIIGIVISGLVQKLAEPQKMPFDWLLNLGVSTSVLAGLLNAVLCFFIFPMMRFSQFWVGLILCRGLFSAAWPLPNTMQVAESPAKSAGKMFAILTASLSVIPALQHVIIGRLWKVGGSDHPWFFRWFGVLHLTATALLIVYYALRKCMDVQRESEQKYRSIGDGE